MNKSSGGGPGPRRRWQPGARAAAVVTSVASIALLAAACGSGPPTTAGGSTYYQKAVAYAQCMRAHGVPNFPDPYTINGGMGYNLSEVDTHSPQYQSANRTCQSQSGRGRS